MTNMTEIPDARTYAAAAKIAKVITVEELAELIAADDNPEIFPGPRQRRRIAMNARMGAGSAVTYDYGNRNGFSEFGCTYLSRVYPPIFRFKDGWPVKAVDRLSDDSDDQSCCPACGNSDCTFPVECQQVVSDPIDGRPGWPLEDGR